MSRASSSQINERERCMHSSLVAVAKAVETWARQSTNGTLVWDVAHEYLDDVWCAWESSRNSETWWAPTDLIAQLERMAAAIADPVVCEAVAAARVVLNSYSE